MEDKLKVKEYLETYKSMDAERANLLAEKRLIELDAALPKGLDYSADKIQVSPADKMPDIVIRMIKRCEIIDKRVAALDEKMFKIQDEINQCKDGISKRLLHMRYVEFKGWGEIAEELGYYSQNSEAAYIKGERHAKALGDFANSLPNLTKPY